MRLGLRPTVFQPGTEEWSKARKLYAGKGKIWERHRHRYEVNPAYVDQLVESGCVFAGKDEKGERMQVLELKGAWTCFSLRYSISRLFFGEGGFPFCRSFSLSRQRVTFLPPASGEAGDGRVVCLAYFLKW